MLSNVLHRFLPFRRSCSLLPIFVILSKPQRQALKTAHLMVSFWGNQVPAYSLLTEEWVSSQFLCHARTTWPTKRDLDFWDEETRLRRDHCATGQGAEWPTAKAMQGTAAPASTATSLLIHTSSQPMSSTHSGAKQSLCSKIFGLKLTSSVD